MLYLYLYWWTHGSNSNPGWWKHHQSMINQHLEAHPPCREASPHPWRAAPHFRVHPGNGEQSHQGLQKRPPSRLLWTPWQKMMTKVHSSYIIHEYFAKKWFKKLIPVRNSGSNILVRPICSHHRLLCSMTNMKEHSREICYPRGGLFAIGLCKFVTCKTPTYVETNQNIFVLI